MGFDLLFFVVIAFVGDFFNDLDVIVAGLVLGCSHLCDVIGVEHPMELSSVNLTILVRVCHVDELTELLFCELDIKHSKDHFELHVIENTVTVCIES